MWHLIHLILKSYNIKNDGSGNLLNIIHPKMNEFKCYPKVKPTQSLV